ncbi:MAG: calcium/sodium antiporter [bacterium]
MTPVLISSILIIVGLTLLVWSADQLISGASALARNLGVSPLIIGLTIVGFGTSAPEMVVSAIASMKGTPELAVGNAIGSNIANIALILGITALLYPLKIESGTLKREFPILILITAVTWVFISDYQLDRSDGFIFIILLVAITGWLTVLGLNSSKSDPLNEDYNQEIPDDMPTSKAVFWLIVGLVLLPFSSSLLVNGATQLAHLYGVSDAIIGLTVVALGTSLPELAAAITGAIKKEDDLALGNIIGSNLFNLLGVLGIAGIIKPSGFSEYLITRDYATMALVTVLLFAMAYGFSRKGKLGRRAGSILLAIYIIYESFLFRSAYHQYEEQNVTIEQQIEIKSP